MFIKIKLNDIKRNFNNFATSKRFSGLYDEQEISLTLDWVEIR